MPTTKPHHATIRRTLACAVLAAITLSLVGGWMFRAIESGSVAMLRTSLRPVKAPEVMPMGYVYREGSGPFASAQLLRRHTGLEPRVVPESPGCGICAQGTITEFAFYEGRSTDAVGAVFNAAADRGVESFAVTEIGWPTPVWRHTVELPTAGDLRTHGTLRLGPVWLATRPAWPGFLFWTAAGTTAALSLGRLFRWMQTRRVPHGHCKACRYDLAGLAEGPCPECGCR